jgi:phosphate transport system substrate-binding protein
MLAALAWSAYVVLRLRTPEEFKEVFGASLSIRGDFRRSWVVMRNLHLRAIATAAIMAFALNAARADVLRIGGTGAATEMLKRLGAAFAAGDEVKVEVIPSLGTSGAIHALSDGALDIAVAGRPLRPEESALGLAARFAVRTPFGLVTSRRNPAGLKSGDIAAIFASGSARWEDGTPVRIILRPKGDADAPLLGSLFPGMNAAIEQARKRADVPVAATDQDNAETAERVPGSLTGAALTQVRLERRQLQFVAIDGVAVSLEALERGIYPHAKTMYFVTASAPQPAAARFIAFLASPDGERLLREAAVLPARE